MTKSRRLTASLAMLLVSAVLLSTASYAWFAMNTQTKAEGFEVEAYTDSLYLEISKGELDDNDELVYDVEVDYNMATTTDLRLVTASLFKTLTYVTLDDIEEIEEDTYYDGTGEYYTLYKGNYIRVTDLVETTSTAGLYKNPTFSLVNTNTLTSGSNYYSYDTSTHTFTQVTLRNESAYGLYVVTLPTAEGEDAHYVPNNKYYKQETITVQTGVDENDAPITVEKVVLNEVSASHTLGTNLKGLYTIDTVNTNVGTTAVAGTTYYVQNGDDFTFVGQIPAGTLFTEHLFWGRAYSSLANEEQAGNTLTLVTANEAANYYLNQTLYLRCAEGTNNASHLKVDDIKLGGATNALTPALRVLLVATTSTDSATPKRISACIYNPAPGANENKFTYLNGGDCFFDTILGNEAETVTVQVYIYFDGTDEVADNAAIASQLLNGQSVEIYFGIDELNYN